MKRVLMISIVLFLMVFMIGGMDAEMNNNVLYSSSNCSIVWNSGSTIELNITIEKNKLYLVGLIENLIAQHSEVFEYDNFLIRYYFIEPGFTANDTTLIFDTSNSNISSFYGWFKTDNWYMGYIEGIGYKKDINNLIIPTKLIAENYMLSNTKKIIVETRTYINLANKTCSLGGYGIEILDTSNRVSALESLQQTLNNTLTSIQITITNVLNTLTGHETRITALENKSCSCQINQTTQIPNYFKYLGSSDRKNIICGYGIDNHLTHIEDLGFICDITYRQLRTGERATCKCKKV